METSTDVDKIYPDLIAAINEMPEIEKTRENPYFKSKYAGLPDIVSQITPVLGEHGLAIVQGGDSMLGITTRIIHSSGQWIQSTMAAKPTKNDPQGYGSMVTYLRRYGLCAMLNIAPDEDDDGNRASEPTNNKDEVF